MNLSAWSAAGSPGEEGPDQVSTGGMKDHWSLANVGTSQSRERPWCHLWNSPTLPQKWCMHTHVCTFREAHMCMHTCPHMDVHTHIYAQAIHIP